MFNVYVSLMSRRGEVLFYLFYGEVGSDDWVEMGSYGLSLPLCSGSQEEAGDLDLPFFSVLGDGFILAVWGR